MKILFYVEPHPIRNTYTHFEDIARKFSSVVRAANHFDVKLFANAQTLKKMLDEKLVCGEQIIPTTRIENELFSTFNVDWESAGKNIWLDLIKGGDIAEYYLPVLRRIWSIFPFDIIVYWGENGAIRLFQKEHNFTAIGMELGCTRPPFFNSLVMDVYGTNGSSVVPKLSINQISDIVSHQTLSANEANYLYSGKDILSYEQQFQPIDTKLFSELSTTQPKVFFPLQLFDDANLLKFSKYNDLSEVVLDVVPRLVEKGYQVIIKPHPAAKHREGADYANKLAYSSLMPWIDSIIWCDENNVNYNNIQLIQLSDFVVTVNSSVGFESLLLDKPCVVLGDAIYKPQGIFPNLDDILNNKFNLNNYISLAGYLRKFFLDGYLIRHDIWSSPKLLLEKITYLHKIYQLYKESPEAIARLAFEHKLEIDEYRKKDAFHITRVLEENKRAKPSTKVEHIDEKDNFFRTIVTSMLVTSKAKNITDFKKWITKTLNSRELRYELFKNIKFVNKSYYLGHKDILEAGYDDVTLHYAKHGGIEETRTPNKHIAAGTNIGELIKIFSNYAEELLLDQDSLTNVCLNSEQLLDRKQQLDNISKKLAKRRNDTVVIAHLYYSNLVSDILDSLKNIKCKFDLIVTLPTWGTEKIIAQVREEYPDAIFYKCMNRGRDIGPFVDLLPIILDKHYQYGLKVHTKNGFFHDGVLITDYSILWRKEFLDSLLGSEERVSAIMSEFRNNPSLNLVGTSSLFLSLMKYPYSDNGEFVIDTLNMTEIEPKQGGFFGGTMFWFRPEMMRPLVDANLSLLSFGAESGAADGEIAHIIERAFGHLASYNEGIVAGVSPDNEDNTVDYYLSPSEISLYSYFSKRKAEFNNHFKKNLIERFSN